MYKLMIVEDEPLIRAGLRVYFNWEELGITTIIEAASGEEGIEQGLLHEPDLIITDIRMPEVNGLQMIEQLRPKLEHSIFIILSGYEDFQYAQQAIRLGVSDYLIKPLQYEESEATIKRCMEILEARVDELARNDDHALLMEDTKRWRHARLFKNWLDQEIDLSEEEWLQQWELHGMSTQGYSYMPLVLAFITPFFQQHEFISTYQQTAEHIVNTWFLTQAPELSYNVYSYSSGTKVYMLIAVDHATWPSHLPLESGLESIVKDRCEQEKQRIYIGIGTPNSQLPRMRNELQLADSSSYYRYFKPEQHVYVAAHYEGMKGYPFNITEDHIRILTQSMEQADALKIQQFMQRFTVEAESHAHQATPQMLFTFVQELIGISLRFAHKRGIAIEDIYNKKLYTFSFLDDYHSISHMFDWLGRFILQLGLSFQTLKEASVHSERLIFSQIEAFIVDHLDQEITLQTVADRFYYNPAYLSRLFKAKLQVNFMSFLTDIRIRQAKEYLKQSRYHVAEIGEMCGYKSYKHFVKTFKKVTLTTPTDYRKSLGGMK